MTALLRDRLAISTCLVAIFTATPFLSAPAHADVPCHQPYYISPGETLPQIAARCGTTVGDIMRLNPKIEDPVLLPAGFGLKIPSSGYVTGHKANYSSSAASQPALRRVSLSDGDYRVRYGDTLGSVANRYGVSVSQLMAANPNLGSPDELYVGEVLRLPRSARSTSYREANNDADLDVIPFNVRGETGFTVRGDNLPPDTRVRIAAVRNPNDLVTLGNAHTDSKGRLRIDVDAPGSLDPGDSAVLLVSTSDGRYRVMSDPVVVPRSSFDARYDERDAGDRTRSDYREASYSSGDDNDEGPYFTVGEQINVEGVVTPEGGQCAAVRNAAGRLFTVTATERHLQPGDRVKISGRVAPSDWCDKGIAVAVTDIDFDNNGDGTYNANRSQTVNNDRPDRARPSSYSAPEPDREPAFRQTDYRWTDRERDRDISVAPTDTEDADQPKEVIRGVVTASNRDCTIVRAFDGTVYGVPARLTSVGFGEGIELTGKRSSRDECAKGITFKVDQARKL